MLSFFRVGSCFLSPWLVYSLSANVLLNQIAWKFLLVWHFAAFAWCIVWRVSQVVLSKLCTFTTRTAAPGWKNSGGACPCLALCLMHSGRKQPRHQPPTIQSSHSRPAPYLLQSFFLSGLLTKPSHVEIAMNMFWGGRKKQCWMQIKFYDKVLCVKKYKLKVESWIAQTRLKAVQSWRWWLCSCAFKSWYITNV